MTQVHPAEFFKMLRWLDGRPLLDIIEPYRLKIFEEALYTFRADGSPLFRRVLTGRGKKNAKTLDAVLAGLYKLLVWHPTGAKGNQIYFVASDLGQANDDLDLCKKLIRGNPMLAEAVVVKANLITRNDGGGFIEILPAQDVQGLHGKTYLFLVVDELHTQKDYRLLEALELDRTRPDAQCWYATYASLYRHAGVPLVDMLKQHEQGTDSRLYVSWYAGSIEEANPSLNGPVGSTLEDIEDARRALPSWMFRRLYMNLPGQPDCAAFNADATEACIVSGRKGLPPDPALLRAGAYRAFVDMGGGHSDDSALAIAHRSPDNGKIILDLLLDQGARRGGTYQVNVAVARFASMLKEYGLTEVTGDRYAGEWPREAFDKPHRIRYIVSEQNRSTLYSAFEPLINSGEVELLDSEKLFEQIIGLVLKGEKIDHAANAHDDHANVCAGVAALLRRSPAVAKPRIRSLDWPAPAPRRALSTRTVFGI